MAVQFVNNPKVGDNVKIEVGNSSDLQIYHDASHSYITNATGDLTISNTGDDLILKSADDFLLYVQGTELAIQAVGNSGVILRHNNVVKFETTSSGVDVTGDITIDSSTATLNIKGSNTGASLINFADAADGNVGRIYYDHTNNFMQFKVNDTEKVRINNSGFVGIGSNSPVAPLEVKSSETNHLTLYRPANTTEGNAGSMNFDGNDSDSNQQTYAKIESFTDDATAGSIAGKIRFSIAKGGDGMTSAMTIQKDAQVSLNQYGQGSYTGTAAYTLQVDSAGNIIEGSTSGGGTVTGSGAATRVAFWSGTSALSSDANLYWDNSNDRLGIGTSAPGAKLDVRGDGAGFFLQSADHKIARIQPRGTGAEIDKGLFSLFTTTTETVRIDTNGSSWFTGGKIGIGTTSPGNKLHVNSGSTSDIVKFENNNGSMVFGQTTALTSLDLASSNAYRIRQGSSTPFKIETSGAVTFDNVISGVRASFVSTLQDATVLSAEGAYSSSGSVKLFEAKRSGSAVAGNWSYDDATTDMSLGTSTAHSFSLKTGNTRAIIIDSSQNVGIDMTPDSAVRLSVSGQIGTTNGTAAAPTHTFYGDDDTGMFRAAANNLAFSSGGTERMRIDSGGDVGIGTIPETAGSTWRSLFVGSSLAFISRQSTTGTDSILANNYYINSSNVDKKRVTGGSSRLFLDSDVIRFQNSGTANADTTITWSERMRIDSSGNVGIGTTAPSQKLQVEGNSWIKGIYYDSSGDAGSSGQVLSSTSTGTNWVSAGGTSGVAPMVKFNRSGINSSTYTMIATVNGDNLASIIQMTMTGTSGNVVFACTFDITVNHSQDIHVKSMNGDYTEVTLRITSNNNEDYSIEAKHNGSTTTTAEVCIFPLADEIITPTTTDPGYTGAEYEHTAVEGWRFGGEDGNVESSNVIVDGNVGIGVTSPNNALDIDSSSTNSVHIQGTGSYNLYSYHDSAGVGWATGSGTSFTNLVYMDSSNNIRTYTNGTEKMRVTSGGNVGIGTTAPASKLQIKTATNQNIAFNLISGGSLNGIQRITAYNDAVTASVPLGINASELYFLSGAAGVERMRIESDGTTILRGLVKINTGADAANPRLYFQQDSLNVNNFIEVDRGTGAMEFYNNGSERMRIDSSGNVGIGTTNSNRLLTIAKGHSDTRMRMFYNNTDDTKKAFIDFWASEPGVTYNGSGIGANINGSPYYGRSVSGQGQTYIRFLNGEFQIWTGASASGTNSTATQKLTVASDGDVGIGDSAPNTKLEVNGDTTIRRQGSETSGELLIGGTTDGGFVDFDSISLQLNTQRDPNTGTFINTGKSNARINLVGANGGSYVTISTASANNTSATEKMRIDSSGEVKINKSIHLGSDSGVVTPSSYNMLIESPSGGTPQLGMYVHNASFFSIKSDGTTANIGWSSSQSREVNFQNTGTGAFLMGVNTGAPTETLTVGGNIHLSANQSYISFNTSGSSGHPKIKMESDGDFSFLNTAGSSSMRIENGGNVGIGTSSPTYGKLVISSSIASSSTYNWLVFDNQASGYGDWNIYKSGNNNLAFGYGVSAGNSYSNAFILEYGGNVGIGNTSPDKKLHVNSGSTSDIVKFENNNGSMVFGQTTALTSLDLASSNAYRIRQGSSTPFKIETSGAVTFGGVISAAGGNAAAPSIIFEGNTDTGFFHPATDEIGFSTAGSERMRIDNGGNVGIGTTAPDGKLTISGGGTSTAPTISVINTSSTAFNHSINAFTPNMTSTESNILVFGKAGSAKNSAYIGYRYSGTAGSNDNLLILGHWASDNLMTITGDGKVGIGTGTTSPTVKLAVEENVNASASILVNNPNSGTGARSNLILTSDAARIDMYATSSTYNGVASWTDAGVINTASSTSGGLILNAQAGGIKFQQGTSEKMRIDSNGDVGIGTTNPVPKLHLVYPNGSYGVDATSGFINQASSGRSTTRLRSIADEASELFFDINGAIRWDISARPSTQGHSLNFYPAASTPAYNNVAAHSLQLSQNGDVIVTGSGSSGNMGIGTTAPGERLEVDGLIKSRKGIYTHKGIATGGGTNTNKWQKFATASYSSFSYSAFKLLIQIKGDTSNVNTNAEVDISYKFQNNNGRIYANITNYGSYPLTSSNFEIYRNGTSTSGTLSFYIYINKNYSEPVYSVIGTGNLIFSSSVIGTSLSGETNDAWTTKNISNTLTIDADSGYVGIGTTAPAVTLDVAGVVRSTNLSTKYAQLESNSSGGVVKGVGGNGFLVRSYGDSYFNGGDFGIGTTSPDEKLHIASSNKTKDGILEGTNNILLEDSNATGSSVGEPIGGILFKQNDQTTAAGVTAFMGAMHASSDGDANLTFATGTAGSEPQPRMTVRYDGNVGIGVGDPNNRLDIDSSSTNSVHIQGTGSYNLYSYHDSGGVGWATGSGTSYTNLLYMNANNNSMSFYTGSSVKMSITNGIVNNISGTGFVGIGTTSPAVVNGTTFGGAMLHVKGPSNIGRLVLEGNVQGTMLMNASGSTANKRLKFMQAKSVNGSSGGDAEFRMGKVTDSGTETTQLSIPDSGDVKVNTAGKGIVLVSPDGTTTVRVSINNSGELVLTEI